ncbi:MAG: tetratricopeptide repeat protein [Clostridia bacterium]
MLDIGKELARFLAIKELDVLDAASQGIDSDELRKSVMLYNQALESLHSKSEDIATIELKKAISINPDFMEAKILLGLCYILRNQLEQAEELLRGITESDNTIAKAYQYLKHIEKIRYKKDNRKGGLFPLKAPISIKIKPLQFHFGIMKGILVFIAGVLVTSVFFYNAIGNFKSLNDVDTVQWNTLEKSYKDKINTYSNDLKAAEINIEKSQQQLADKDKEIAYLNNIKKIILAEKLYNEGSTDDAGELLLTLKNIEFYDVEKEKYDALYAKIIPQLAREYYYKGYNLYNSGKYSEAIQPLNKSIQFDIKNGNEYQYALYFAARCYQITGNHVNASNYYNQIINLFPDSQYAAYSKNRLKEISKN